MPAKPSLGLYFNDNFIEVSQVSVDGKRLERFNQLILPQGVVVNSEIVNKSAFVQILRQLFSSAKPSQIGMSGNVVIGINDSRVFLSEFSVANIPGKDINDAIEYQVRNSLPVLPSGVETDWQIIGKTAEGQIEVLLAAIPRTIIDSCVSVCTSVGLRVLAVEPAVFANIRIIEESELTGKNQLLVYLGENFGVFSFITSGNPRFSDFLPQEEINKSGSLSKTVFAYINFAASKHPNRPVSEVIVSGSRQDIDMIVADLKAQGIVAIKASSRLAKTKVSNHTLLHTSHGLSLKTLDQVVTINLLPIDFRLEAIKDRLINTWKLVLDFLIIFSVIGLITLFYLNKQSTDRLTGLRLISDQYNLELNTPENQASIKQADRLNQVTSQLLSLRGVTGGSENILKQLSAITPNGITLTSVVLSRNPGLKKLYDPGSSWVITGTAESRDLVLNFYDSLLAYSGFADGKLYFGSLEKDSELTFRIANVPTK